MKKLLCIILCLGIMLSSANIVFAGDEISWADTCKIIISGQ